jgi:hypothetical protein
MLPVWILVRCQLRITLDPAGGHNTSNACRISLTCNDVHRHRGNDHGAAGSMVVDQSAWSDTSRNVTVIWRVALSTATWPKNCSPADGGRFWQAGRDRHTRNDQLGQLMKVAARRLFVAGQENGAAACWHGRACGRLIATIGGAEHCGDFADFGCCLPRVP